MREEKLSYFDYSGANSKTIAVDRNVNMSFTNNTYKEDNKKYVKILLTLKRSQRPIYH